MVRANVQEGHRVFAAFHPPNFMRQLLGQYFTILAHYEGKIVAWGIEQDYWIVEKNNLRLILNNIQLSIYWTNLFVS